MSEASIDEIQHAQTADKRQSLLVVGLRLLWLLIAAVFAAVIYYQATRDDVLPINKITFSGDFQRLSERDLKPIVEQDVQGNFFTLSVASLYSSLIELPWVEKVWIHRVWPDKININLLEQQPVAILDSQGLLNKSGEVFLNNADEFKNKLPVFVVPKQYEKEMIKFYYQYLALLETYDLRISRFYMNDRKTQTLILTNGVKISLGKRETAQRLTRFLQIYDSELKQNRKKIHSADLRYTNGFAIKWH